ncbi:DNA-directed RNA polymerase subunit H [Candidatus Woesearchaeota archaeon]|nr:MAG: DNA-directed RNA polymerase subunit H [Candidatus Woesearchaeota archaeon]
MAKEKLDISKHILVPKHTKLSDEEVKSLLEEYNISLKQLPKILKNDPAISDLGAKPGDVIKIERHSPTVGKTYYYRVVSNA